MFDGRQVAYEPATAPSTICLFSVICLFVMSSIVLALWLASLVYAVKVEVTLADVIVTGRGSRKMCLTPRHDELYVSNHDDNTVSVIRVSSRAVTHTVSVCHHPRTIASTRDGSKVFVGCRNAISVITTRDKNVVHLSCCGTVTAFVGTADSRTMYVAGEMQGLFALDTRSFRSTLLDPLPAPMYLALSADEKYLYVNYQHSGPGGSPGHDAIAQFATHGMRLVDRITGLPNVGGSLALSPDGRFLWAAGDDACFARQYDHAGCLIVPAGVINIVDLHTHRLWRRLSPLELAGGLVLSPNKQLMLANGRFAVYDAATATLIGPHAVIATDDCVLLDDDTGFLAQTDTAAVTVFHLHFKP